MANGQKKEPCMNAGLDVAIGDYIFEFESAGRPISSQLIFTAYQESLKGNDIVFVSPKKERLSSKLFYYLFKRFSPNNCNMRTSVFSLISRRALNRFHAINENLPYRKATYTSCGLKVKYILYDGEIADTQENRFGLAVDTLILYTSFGYRLSLAVTLLTGLFTFFILFYALIFYVLEHPIAGWTSTACILSVGFTGVFAVLAFIMKYLELLLKSSYNKMNYYVSDIERI